MLWEKTVAIGVERRMAKVFSKNPRRQDEPDFFTVYSRHARSLFSKEEAHRKITEACAGVIADVRETFFTAQEEDKRLMQEEVDCIKWLKDNPVQAEKNCDDFYDYLVRLEQETKELLQVKGQKT